MHPERRRRLRTPSAPSFMGADPGLPGPPLPTGGRAARAFTPLATSAALLVVGAGALGVAGPAAGGRVHWATQGLLWLTAGAAAGISLSGSA